MVNVTSPSSATSYANNLAMYQAKPNRWLQDAIRRGKKLRREAHQQAQLKSQTAMLSPVNSNDQAGSFAKSLVAVATRK